jgi:crotonobetainyl-CoA:carnitine CoA-transferase CaiB-like acyl-CoA transferase
VGGIPWAFTRTPATLTPPAEVGHDTAEILDEVEALPEPVATEPARTDDNRPPLAGLRVIELAQGIAGPYAGLELVDAGADVVKVEHTTGDIAREWEPRTPAGWAAAFVQLNRGKRSIQLDLESDDGRETLRRLLAASDVLIEDADLTRELGLDLGPLAAENEHLVHGRISGYGPEGPMAARPGGEITTQLAAEMTAALGRTGGSPMRVGTDVASMYAGIYCVQGILATLFHRERGGPGQTIDVSLFGCALVMRSTLWAALSNPDDWWGFHLDSYTKEPETGFKTKDGAVSFLIGALSDDQWLAMLQELGFDPVADAEKIQLMTQAGNPVSSRQRVAVTTLWQEAIGRFTTRELMAILERYGSDATPLNDFPAILSHPQTKHMAIVQEIDLDEGRIPAIRSPWRLHATPALEPGSGPPALGQHTAEILKQIAVSSDV